MRRRIIATVLTALSVTALVGPAGAGGIVDIAPQDGEKVGICVDSRLLTRGYCVRYDPPIN